LRLCVCLCVGKAARDFRFERSVKSK